MALRVPAVLAATIALAGCASQPAQQWYWYRAGATQSALEADHGQCTAQAFQAGTGNLYAAAITQDACMRGKGWQRVTR